MLRPYTWLSSQKEASSDADEPESPQFTEDKQSKNMDYRMDYRTTPCGLTRARKTLAQMVFSLCDGKLEKSTNQDDCLFPSQV